MYDKAYVKRMMLYSCFTHILRMLNVRCTSNNLVLLAVRGHGIHFALIRAQFQSVSATFYFIIIQVCVWQWRSSVTKSVCAHFFS